MNLQDLLVTIDINLLPDENLTTLSSDSYRDRYSDISFDCSRETRHSRM
jgi:hypothetical protein